MVHILSAEELIKEAATRAPVFPPAPTSLNTPVVWSDEKPISRTGLEDLKEKYPITPKPAAQPVRQPTTPSVVQQKQVPLERLAVPEAVKSWADIAQYGGSNPRLFEAHRAIWESLPEDQRKRFAGLYGSQSPQGFSQFLTERFNMDPNLAVQFTKAAFDKSFRQSWVPGYYKSTMDMPTREDVSGKPMLMHPFDYNQLMTPFNRMFIQNSGKFGTQLQKKMEYSANVVRTYNDQFLKELGALESALPDVGVHAAVQKLQDDFQRQLDSNLPPEQEAALKAQYLQKMYDLDQKALAVDPMDLAAMETDLARLETIYTKMVRSGYNKVPDEKGRLMLEGVEDRIAALKKSIQKNKVHGAATDQWEMMKSKVKSKEGQMSPQQIKELRDRIEKDVTLPYRELSASNIMELFAEPSNQSLQTRKEVAQMLAAMQARGDAVAQTKVRTLLYDLGVRARSPNDAFRDVAEKTLMDLNALGGVVDVERELAPSTFGLQMSQLGRNVGSAWRLGIRGRVGEALAHPGLPYWSQAREQARQAEDALRKAMADRAAQIKKLEEAARKGTSVPPKQP